MSVKYLDKFTTVADKTQADQVLQLLNKKKQSGEIRTVEEFVERLNTLIRELTQVKIAPTFSILSAGVDETIDHETYNYMLDRIEDDLVTGFKEANNIDEVQRSHRAIIKDVTFKKLRQAITELEKKVKLYDFIETENDGYSVSISSSFGETDSNRAARRVPVSVEKPRQTSWWFRGSRSPYSTSTSYDDTNMSLFIDPRRDNRPLKPRYDAEIDLVGEKLLSANNRTLYNIRSVKQIYDDEAYRGDIVVDVPTLTLSNIKDNTVGTYWMQASLFDTIQSYVRVKIELDLSGREDINFIEIEPVSLHGMVLERIDYLDKMGEFDTLVSPDLDLLVPVSVNFEEVATSKIRLIFRDDSPDLVEFKYDAGSNTLLNQAQEQPPETYIPSMDKAMNELNKALSSSKVKDEILKIAPSAGATQFVGYEYVFGIDNVRVGYNAYEQVSIYISPEKVIESSSIGQVSLKSIEVRPYATSVTGSVSNTSTTYDSTDSYFFFSSMEYWVIRRDFGEKGNIISTSFFPIIPLNTTRTHHERLYLTTKSSQERVTNDVGATMFFTDDIVGSVKVYRNGRLLSQDVDWTDFTTATNKTPGSGESMKFYIKIANPYAGDIYTVTYTPMTSSTRNIPDTFSAYTGSGIDVVDLKGDASVRTLSNHSIVLDTSKDENIIAKSKMYLMILLRNNSARKGLTAAVEEYMLVMGERDAKRFED